MRKLATVREINWITPIAGADRIELAKIDGWQVVVQKDKYLPGDEVIFCEIDSALPVDNPGIDPTGDLAKRGVKTANGKRYHIVKTVKLRKTLSQGLILPVDILKPRTIWEHVKYGFGGKPYTVGEDVTERLGILKYDRWAEPWAKPAKNGNPRKPGQRDPNIIGEFPCELAQKSDSERVQNLGKYWPEIIKHEWIVTEKIDGQSITIGKTGGKLRIASRNYEIKEHPALEWAKEHGIGDTLNDGEAIQGEWAGPGVQGNRLGLDENQLFVFSFFKDGRRTAIPPLSGIPSVPVIDSFDVDEIPTPDELIEYADGLKSRINKDRLAEGIVLHEKRDNGFDFLGGRANFKAISNKYLLKEK